MSRGSILYLSAFGALSRNCGPNTMWSQVAQESFQNLSAPKMTAHRVQEDDASRTTSRTFLASEIACSRDRGVKPQMTQISSPTLDPSSTRMASASDDVAVVDESLRSSSTRGRGESIWPSPRPPTSSRWQRPACAMEGEPALAISAATELDSYQ